ncbi:uncharacterized protein LOC106664998 isoform X1 [Cimex lectularius]|uniref:Odorant receptor n=1 Tax=Cimex lectularius TaxID=79782 RepID=A0A8I6RK42_CIMLE|nr:uncharacterized protein LOC106664998 isoform X1 [Cimex lectularius]
MCSEDFIFASEYFLNASFALFTQSIFTFIGIRADANTTIHKIIIKEFPKYKNIDRSVLAKINEVNKEQEIHLKLLVFFMSLAVPNLLFLEPFLEDLYDSKSIKIQNGDERLIMPMWSPDPENLFVHYVIFSIQIFQPCITSIVSLTGIFFFMNLSHSLIEQLRILNWSISNLEKRAKSHYLSVIKNDKNNTKWTYMDSIDLCLNENIAHLNILKRFKKGFQDVTSPTLFCVFTLATFFIAFTGYVILESEGHPGKLTFAVNVIIIEVYSLGFFNTFGQYVIDEVFHIDNITFHIKQLLRQQSEKLRHSVYGVDWYHLDKRCCKKLHILQTMCLEPMVLIVGGLLPLNMASFQKVLNSSYSVVNMLMAFK